MQNDYLLDTEKNESGHSLFDSKGNPCPLRKGFHIGPKNRENHVESKRILTRFKPTIP